MLLHPWLRPAAPEPLGACTTFSEDLEGQLAFAAGFVSGFEHLEPLVEFRDWLQAYSRDPSNRMTERRNGAPGLGPFTMEARRTILAELRKTETEVGLSLISDAELRRVEEIWTEDKANMLFRQADRIFSTLEET